MGKLANIPKFDKMFWKNVGDELTDEIISNTRERGRDVHGKKFKKYKTHTPFWFTKKIKGKTVRIYAEDYPTRKPKLFRGTSSNKVDLTLTGDMLNGLSTKGFTDESVVIGWSGTNAKKVQWNADMGRAITLPKKPLSNKALKLFYKLMNKRIKRNADKETAKPINFKIGR